jgi:hypothetical protein
MNRRCSHCGSTNVRRSGRVESEAGAHLFHSPYRCRDCERRFWVISRKTIFGTAAGGAMFFIVLLLWSGSSLIARHGGSSVPSPAPGTSLDTRTDAIGPQSDARMLGEESLRQLGARVEGSTVGVVR